jgi:hypothetical protein
MKKTLNFQNLDNGGKIIFTKKKNIILVQVSIDNYGFEIWMDKEQLKELIQ